MNISYEDYQKLHPGRMPEAEFNSLLPAAAAYVDVITANRAQTAAGYKAERVKMAVCAAINEMHAQNAARNEGGARIASISNDGYSESYGSDHTAEREAAALHSAVMLCLSGTGLAGAL